MDDNSVETMPDINTTEHADESMDIVQGAIQENPVTPEMAKSLGKMYTLYTTKQLDLLLGENPDLTVISGFNKLLKEAIKRADENGDYTDIRRFLNSEAEKMGYGSNVENDPHVEVGKKLRQMADLL